MTFSDNAVVDFIDDHFIPVWESIAPVSTITYHLADERSVKGIVNGEIAVYFCRPDGKAFDILPGLHSPESLLEAMTAALDLYTVSNRGQDLEHVRQYHRDAQSLESTQEILVQYNTDRTTAALQLRIDALETQILSLKKRARELAESPDGATLAMRQANAKNVVAVYGAAVASSASLRNGKNVVSAYEPASGAFVPLMSVIAPQDPTTRGQVRRQLASRPDLRTPDEWKQFVFEDVMGQPLEGTEQVFASPTTPIRVVEHE